jgi:hypothetical protein
MLQHLLHSFVFKRLPGILLGLLIGFGLVLAAHASEPEACGFGLVQCDESGVVWNFAAIGADNLAQLNASDGLDEFIIAFGFFLNRLIIPLLFALAFLFFLYYIARFFVLDRANDKNREEAKQRALWGLGAFVFMVSIWGIVNLFVSGFGWQDSTAVCPDYMPEVFCGEIELESGGSNPFKGSGSSFSDRGSGGFLSRIFRPSSGSDFVAFEHDTSGGSTIGPDTTGSAPAMPNIISLFAGSLTDAARFSFGSGAPEAETDVLAIPPNNSCVAGLRALQTSAQIEPLQTAYALHKSSSGATTWVNLTDSTNLTSVGIDADELRLSTPADSIQTAIIHTHPQAIVETAGIAASGIAPSVSDFELMCDDVANDAQYVVVDGTNIWLLETLGAMCPRRGVDEDNLAIISILSQLALMAPSERESTLRSLLSTNALPGNVRADLEPYLNIDWNNQSAASIMLRADDLAREGNMRIRRLTVDDFCAQF